jgi:hypothetical protein
VIVLIIIPHNIDEAQLQIWKKNAKIAAAQLNWEQEELKLLEVYKRFL